MPFDAGTIHEPRERPMPQPREPVDWLDLVTTVIGLGPIVFLYALWVWGQIKPIVDALVAFVAF